jgi:hypothetical protein
MSSHLIAYIFLNFIDRKMIVDLPLLPKAITVTIILHHRESISTAEANNKACLLLITSLCPSNSSEETKLQVFTNKLNDFY